MQTFSPQESELNTFYYNQSESLTSQVAVTAVRVTEYSGPVAVTAVRVTEYSGPVAVTAVRAARGSAP